VHKEKEEWIRLVTANVYSEETAKHFSSLKKVLKHREQFSEEV
jgi:hypothetical protein